MTTAYSFKQNQKDEPRKDFMYTPVWLDNVLSNQQIQEIVDVCESNLQMEPAQVGGGVGGENGVVDSSMRRTMVSWMIPEVSPKWFPRFLEDLILSVNHEHFKFLLTGAEAAQYTKYESTYRGEYKWHSDTMAVDSNIRKLSVSILLSDPTDYEGGNLILSPHGSPMTVGDLKGRAVIFPSWTPHCVTPVLKGVRRSLVVWSYGPAFV